MFFETTYFPHIKDVTCPANAGACAIRKDEKSDHHLIYENLGEISDKSTPDVIKVCDDCEEYKGNLSTFLHFIKIYKKKRHY